MLTQTLTVAAVCFRDADSRVLTVRKKGSERFQLPGGKLDAGETVEAAAVREVAEEIRVELTHDDITLLGAWSAPAANEADTTVDATVFVSTAQIVPVAAAEIEELLWVHPSGDHAEEVFAPLLRLHVFPALASM